MHFEQVELRLVNQNGKYTQLIENGKIIRSGWLNQENEGIFSVDSLLFRSRDVAAIDGENKSPVLGIVLKFEENRECNHGIDEFLEK